MQLEPLSYHVEVARRLETTEPALWDWFGSEAFANRYKEKTSDDLLRSAIRLDRSGVNEHRYQLAEKARDALGLSEPITLYQMHDKIGVPNAYLVFVPGQIVIAFDGRILELLATDAELLDLLGHEISHYKLFTTDNGRFLSADRLLRWMLQRDHCPAEFFETWRRYQLYSEIYCDIGGLIACGDLEATVRGLVRVIADFKDANADSYLAQAREIMAKGFDGSRGTTHPELHVRVLAVANASQMDAGTLNAMIRTLISGRIELGALDLIDQNALCALTRQAVDGVLSKADARSDGAVAHARQMFTDYALPDARRPAPAVSTDTLAPSAIDYLAYILLDFATVDDNASNAAIAACAIAADEIGIGARFREIARQELKGRRAILSGLVTRAA